MCDSYLIVEDSHHPKAINIAYHQLTGQHTICVSLDFSSLLHSLSQEQSDVHGRADSLHLQRPVHRAVHPHRISSLQIFATSGSVERDVAPW